MKVFTWALVVVLLLGTVSLSQGAWYEGLSFVQTCYTPLTFDEDKVGCFDPSGNYYSLQFTQPYATPDSSVNDLQVLKVHSAYGPVIQIKGKSTWNVKDMMRKSTVGDNLQWDTKYYEHSSHASASVGSDWLECGWKELQGMYIQMWVWVPSSFSHGTKVVLANDDWSWIVVNGVKVWEHIGCCELHNVDIVGHLKKGEWNQVNFLGMNGCAPGYLFAYLSTWR